MFNKNTQIPLFFAFDNNYVIPAAVAFYSLLLHASKEYQYSLFVLHEDISMDNQNLLLETIASFDNVKLEFRNMDAIFKKEWSEISGKGHYTKECLYKLIPMNEFAGIDRIIWSDVDVIFKDDISKIFFMLDDNNYIAGVRVCGKLNDYYESMDMPDDVKAVLKNGIGAGILVYNLKKMRDDNIYAKIMSNLEKFKNVIMQPEQDILNLVFNGKISYLPLRYCFCTYMYNLYKDKTKMNLRVGGNIINYLFGLYTKNLKYDGFYGETELKAAFTNPAIIHYATSVKPWNSALTKRKSDWIFYLLQTPFAFKYFWRRHKNISGV